jgi:hypothetical protein
LITIYEVEELLEKHPFLPKPRYIFMVEDIVIAPLSENLVALVKGATPVNRQDVIMLTILADEVTVVHEVLHTMGLGELGARVLAPILVWLRRLVPPVTREGKVRYVEVARPHPKVRVYELVS